MLNVKVIYDPKGLSSGPHLFHGPLDSEPLCGCFLSRGWSRTGRREHHPSAATAPPTTG